VLILFFKSASVLTAEIAYKLTKIIFTLNLAISVTT